jgi:hypothetical protein
LCGQYYYFADNQFKFLVEWDPAALLYSDGDGDLPIHHATNNHSIRGFQLVFEYGIRYYPNKNGINLLYQKSKNIYGKTPFQYACHSFGQEELMKVIDDTLAFYSGDTPINIIEALVTAAIDEDIHLDCVHLLVRSESDILQKLLSTTPTAMDSSIIGNEINDDNNDENDNLIKKD